MAEPGLRERLAAAGRERAAAEFDRTVMGRRSLDIYRAVLGVTMTIFVLVGGWLLYSALRFRVKSGDPDIEPPQVHGSTRLELGWTLAPVLVLVALSAYTLDHVGTVKDAPSNAMIVNGGASPDGVNVPSPIRCGDIPAWIKANYPPCPPGATSGSNCLFTD